MSPRYSLCNAICTSQRRDTRHRPPPWLRRRGEDHGLRPDGLDRSLDVTTRQPLGLTDTSLRNEHVTMQRPREDAQPDEGSSRQRLIAPPVVVSQALLDDRSREVARRHQARERRAGRTTAPTDRQQTQAFPPLKRLKLTERSRRTDGPSRARSHVARSQPSYRASDMSKKHPPPRRASLRSDDLIHRHLAPRHRAEPSALDLEAVSRPASRLTRSEDDGRSHDSPARSPRNGKQVRRGPELPMGWGLHPDTERLDTWIDIEGLPDGDPKGHVLRLLRSANIRAGRVGRYVRGPTSAGVRVHFDTVRMAEEAARRLRTHRFDGRQPLVQVYTSSVDATPHRQSRQRPHRQLAPDRDRPSYNAVPANRDDSHSPGSSLLLPTRAASYVQPKRVDVVTHQLSRACAESMPWYRQTRDREVRMALLEAEKKGFQVDDHYCQALELIMEGHYRESDVSQDETQTSSSHQPTAATDCPDIAPTATSRPEHSTLSTALSDNAKTPTSRMVSPRQPPVPDIRPQEAPFVPPSPDHIKNELRMSPRSQSKPTRAVKRFADLVFPFRAYETVSTSAALLDDVHAFVKTFLQLFDESRGSLVDYYAPQATFSYCIYGQVAQMSARVISHGRNLRQRTPGVLATTSTQILNILRTLPPVQHDFEQPFSYDCWQLDDSDPNSPVQCTVHGEWEEFLTSETRSFSRSLILIKPSAKFQVQSDQLVVRKRGELFPRLRTAEPDAGIHNTITVSSSIDAPLAFAAAAEAVCAPDEKVVADGADSSQREPIVVYDSDEGTGPSSSREQSRRDHQQPQSRKTCHFEDSSVAFFETPAVQRKSKMRAYFDCGASYVAVAKTGDLVQWSKADYRSSVTTIFRAPTATDIHCAAYSIENRTLYMGHQTSKTSEAVQLTCATVSGDGAIRPHVVDHRPHIDGISSIGVLPATEDALLLATGGWDHRMHIWRLKANDPSDVLDVQTLPSGHRSVIQALEWSDRHNLLLSGGSDGRIVGWDLEMMRASSTKWKEACKVNQVQRQPDSDLLVVTLSTHKDQMRFYDVRDCAPAGRFGFLSLQLLNLTPLSRGAFSPSGRLFALPAEDKIRIWDVRDTREPVYLLASPSPGCVQSCFESELELTVLESCSFAYHRLAL